MNFAASPVLALTLPTWRSRLLLSAFILGFGVLVGRAAYLQVLNDDFLQASLLTFNANIHNLNS